MENNIKFIEISHRYGCIAMKDLFFIIPCRLQLRTHCARITATIARNNTIRV